MSDIRVYKNRRNVLRVDMGIDVSGDTITSQIRSKPDLTGAHIADWTVTFETDGTDGIILLTIDDSVASNIQATSGYMDVKRVSAGEPYPGWDKPLEVEIIGVVTE